MTETENQVKYGHYAALELAIALLTATKETRDHHRKNTFYREGWQDAIEELKEIRNRYP